MNNRTQNLQNIRPEINVKVDQSNALELFQSKTLRPVLKFQNELILAFFSSHLNENKILFNTLKDEKKEEIIHAALKKNISLKKELLGMTVGLFTVEEFSFYIYNKPEISKRIVELIIRRISDQKNKL
jgi:hypothetical protein